MANRRAHIGHALPSLAFLRGKSPVSICERRVTTGAQLLERVAALASGLHQLGLQCGDRVAIAALNSEFYLEWLLAVPCAGGIIAPFNCRWSIQEAIEAVQQIQPSLLVVDHHFITRYPAFKNRKPNLGIVIIGTGSHKDPSFLHAESIIQLVGRQNLQLCWAPNDIALICFTSGTTGRPKGVAISHNALVIQSLAKIAMIKYSCNDVYLHNLPLCHIGGLSSAHAMIMAGGCHIFLPKFQAPIALKAIKEHGVTAIITVPTMLNDLVSLSFSRNEARESFPSVTTILNGAGSLSTHLLEKAVELFPLARIISAYGMTEACSSMSFVTNKDPTPNTCYLKDSSQGGSNLIFSESKNSPDTSCYLGGYCVGRPAPHVDIIIETPSHTNASLFREGNVLVRGPHMMNGYWEHSKVTEAAFDEQGWFDTGDVGWMDEKGRLWLLGRKKDVIKSGGETVSSFEVEDILSRHPAILAVTVIGIQDARLNEIVAAIFLLREGWKWEDESGVGQISGSVKPVQAAGEVRVVSPSSLRAYCQQQGLSRYKVPRILVKRATPFPVTPTGKVKKDLMRMELSLHLTSQVADCWHSKL